MVGERSASGARRSGDDYQDLAALDVLVEMLEHPDRFRFVELEARGAGQLDDVVAVRADGRILARQVKFSVNPDEPNDPWTWSDFLDRPTGKSGQALDSLLQKWRSSLVKLRGIGPLEDVGLVSNRKLATELRGLLDVTQRIVFDRIPEGVTRTEILAQLEGEAAARDFFSLFRFDADKLSMGIWEEGLRRRFLSVGGDLYGWFALKDELRSWIRERTRPTPDGRITIKVLRRAAGWLKIQAIPQDFEVPRDYVIPQVFHTSFLELALKGHPQPLILSAPPGYGKSTFLSLLVRELRQKKKAVLRHHYFLSTGDKTGDRFSYSVVASSIMHDLAEDYLEALESQAAHNPRPDQLETWLDQAAQHFHSRDEFLTLMVDGLDHVYRQRGGTSDLEDLFAVLLKPRAGLLLILGTQPVDDSWLPRSFVRTVPRRDWFELPRMDFEGVAEWLRHHADAIGGDQPDALVAAFHARSGGHPLVLRYLLNSLLEQSLPATAYSVESLPGAPATDVQAYYTELWKALSEPSQRILCLVCACKWRWTEEWIIECLDPSLVGGIGDALRKVSHLLTPREVGLQPFHASLAVFVAEQQEYQALFRPLLRLAKEWLEKRAPYYVALENLWLVQSSLGDCGPLISGPSREWIADSVCQLLGPRAIRNILECAALKALDSGQLVGWASSSLLNDYFDPDDSGWESVLLATLRGNLHLEGLPLVTRLLPEATELSLKQLTVLAEFCAANGASDEVRRLVATGEETYRRTRRSREVYESREYLALCALDNDVDVDWLNSAVASLSTDDIWYWDAQEVAEAVVHGHRMATAFELLRGSMTLSAPVQAAMQRRLAPYIVSNGVQLPPTARWNSPTAELFRSVATWSVPHVPEFPSAELFGQKDLHVNAATGGAFVDAFFAMFTWALLGDENRCSTWLKGIGQWPGRVLAGMFRFSADAVAALSAGRKVEFANLFEAVFQVAGQPERGSRDDFAYVAHARSALLVISSLLLDLQTLLRIEANVVTADIEKVAANALFDMDAWLKNCARRKHALVSNGALLACIERRHLTLREEVSPCADRATVLSALAGCAAHAEDKERFVRLLREGAIAAGGHGYHKDMLLFSVVDIADAALENGLSLGKKWLLGTAAAAANIADFTDSDHTRYLPHELGAAIAARLPERFPGYYFWLLESQRYWDSDRVFESFLADLKLDQPVAEAIAATAVDDANLRRLYERERRGEAGASRALCQLNELLHCSAAPPDPEDQVTTSSLPTRTLDIPRRIEPSDAATAQLVKHVTAATPADGEEVLSSWVSYWHSVGRGAEALAVVDSHPRLKSLSASDPVVQVRLAVQGAAAAFPHLVSVQANRSGWERFLYEEAESKSRWELVKRFYPERSLQFLIRSLQESRRPASATGRMQRIVRFCFELGRSQEASQLAEAFVSFARGSTAMLPLREPGWTATPPDTNPSHAVLAIRLLHPSGLVRERACTALSRLLISTSETRLLDEALCRWVESSQLETDDLLRPLIILRAKLFNPDLVLGIQPRRSTSVATELLETVLGVAGGSRSRQHSGDAPSDFPTTSSWDAYYDNIPGVYRKVAASLQRESSTLFERQWRWEFHELVRRRGSTDQGELGAYWGRSEDRHLMSFDPRLFEVFRSALLRAIAWGLDGGRISERSAMRAAMTVLPVDAELWALAPQSLPENWPTTTVPQRVIDTLGADILNRLARPRSPIDTDGKWLLAFASGVVPGGVDSARVTVVGIFARRLATSSDSCTREMFDWACSFGGAYAIVRTETPGTRGTVQFVGSGNPSTFHGLSVLPVTVSLTPAVIPRWQPWRAELLLRAPIPDLAGRRFKAWRGNGFLAFGDSDSQQETARWFDWTANLRERPLSNRPIGAGHQLHVRLTDVFAYEDVSRSRFCWLVRVEVPKGGERRFSRVSYSDLYYGIDLPSIVT